MRIIQGLSKKSDDQENFYNSYNLHLFSLIFLVNLVPQSRKLLTKKQSNRTSIQNSAAFFLQKLKFCVNEELYNDKIHIILVILSDEELYPLKIRFMFKLFAFQTNHFPQSWP